MAHPFSRRCNQGDQDMIHRTKRPFLLSVGVLAAAAVLSLAWCQSSEGQDSAPAKSSGASAGAPAQSTGKTAATDQPAGQRVFYASHSLMWDMPPVLAQQVEAFGIKGHTIVGHQRIGVSRAMQHWNLAHAKNQAKDALQEGKVDVFVMSPLVHPDEGITNFVKLGLEHNPNMKFLIQISWPGLGYTDNEQFNAKGKGGGGFGGAKGGMFRTPADNKPPEEL